MKFFFLKPATWMRWHRWLGYLVVLQFLAWFLGGLYFALVPFKENVRGQDVFVKPPWQAPSPINLSINTLDPELGAVKSIQSVVTAAGAGLKVQFEKGLRIQDLNGHKIDAPSKDAIQNFAKEIYQGKGEIRGIEKMNEVPKQLGIVRELGGKKDVWRITYQDQHNTRLYFDAQTGEFITARTDAWVWFDFLWRLHVMDYAEGENFNNNLLRFFTVLSVLMIFTGLILSIRNLVRRRI